MNLAVKTQMQLKMKLYSLPEKDKFRENLLTLLQSRFQRSGKRGELRPQSSAPQLQTG